MSGASKEITALPVSSGALSGTTDALAPPGTMDRCLAARAESTPDAVAVVSGALSLTHGELQRLARRWAGALRARGIRPGSMVGLHVDRSHYTVIGIAAILEAGAAYVPLEPTYPTRRLRFIARDAGVSLIVTQRARAGELGLNVPLLCLDDEPPPGIEVAHERRSTTSDIAYVTYTSGSTGAPKGVPMPHRGICRSHHWLQGKFPYRPGDRALFKSPLGFDVSSRWEILWPLASGGAVVIARPGGTQDPAYLANLIADESVTVMHFVPSMLDVFLDEPAVTRCHGLRRVFSGGEALSCALKRRFFARFPDCELIDIYGATETIVVTYRRCHPADADHERPIGRPLAALPIYLLDEARQPVEPGQPGELHVGGDFLAAGYLGQPERTAERFIPFPETLAPPASKEGAEEHGILFRTGDWARELPSGDFEHLGRLDHQVKVRGVRVELGEIEAALESSSLVKRAVVVARAQAERGTKLVAHVRCEDVAGSAPTTVAGGVPLQLRKHLAGLLPAPMIPADFIIVDGFPLNPNGKIDRVALARSVGERWPLVGPATPTEVRVAALWKRLLGVAEIGRDEDFFAIGGDSLLAMRLLVHIRSEFEFEIPPRELAAGLTVAELARWLDAGQVPERERDDMSVVELRSEVRLAGDIQPSEPLPWNSGLERRAVLLTGATGFFGAFVLADLLEQTDAVVYCLVRAEPDMARERLVSARERYGLVWHGASERVQPLIGDLSALRLGLDPDEFVRFGERVGAVYHVGAHVNEATGYSVLRAVNVDGTCEVIRLASLGGAHLHFVSSTAVFESSGYLDAAAIDDDAPLDAAHRVYGGYAQSTWVAEALVMEARRRGLPATIYRPGALSGDSRTGGQDWEQVLGRLLRGILVQQAAPVADVWLALTPVNFANRAMVHLSRQEWAQNRNFNLVNPESISLTRLVELARSLGHSIALEPYSSWVDAVAEAIVKDARHPLSGVFPLLSGYIPGTDRSALTWSNLTARVRCGAAPMLARAGITCPPPDRDLLSLYLDRASREVARS